MKVFQFTGAGIKVDVSTTRKSQVKAKANATAAMLKPLKENFPTRNANIHIIDRRPNQTEAKKANIPRAREIEC